MTDNQIEILENTIEQAESDVALMKKLEKLSKNKDFKAIIEDELLNNYARNLVLLLSDPSMQSEDRQADIIKDLEMVGRFRLFLNAIFQKGHQATKTIKDCTDEIDVLRSEGE